MHFKTAKKHLVYLLFATSILLIVLSMQTSFAADQMISAENSTGIKGGIDATEDKGTLTLQPGKYNKTNLDTNITINKDITIKGNGPTKDVIIDAKGMSRIFTTSYNINIKFINITFMNGNSIGDGGAIWNNHLTTTMTFINCSFIDNIAANSTFTNYDGDGAAIYNRGDNLYIESSSFTNNRGNFDNSRGGAIYNTGDDLTIKNSIFTNNAAYDGGAIFNYNGERFTVFNSSFLNNAVGDAVTGIGYGGAIHNYGNYFTVTNSTFTNNSAMGRNGGYGGAIMNSGKDFAISNSSFTNNTALNNNGGGYGGAIYSSNSNFTVLNSAFIGNIAHTGAAIMTRASGPNGYINNSRFEDNTAYNSGAISNEGANFTVANSTFINNQVGNIAGAISNSGANFILVNSIFIGNAARSVNSTSGGAFRNTAANCTIINSTFKDNFGNTTGGAIHNTGTGLTVVNSTFTGNTAKTSGGAIYSGGANCIVANSTFKDNTASTYGGGLYIQGSMLLSGNTMINNTANLGNMIYNGGNIGNLNLTYLNNATIIVKKGQKVTLYATLTDDMGNAVTGKSISFIVDGNSISSVTSIEGKASINYTVGNSAGLIPVSGNYTGSVNYPITLFDGQLRVMIDTNSTINVPNKVKVGKKVNITGIAKDEDGNPIANTVINVTVNGKTYTVTTDDEGNWILSITPNKAGNIDVSVQWNGNESHIGFINNTNFNVEKLITNSTINVVNKIKVGQKTTITGIAKDEFGNPIAYHNITVIVNEKSFMVTTDSEGNWVLNYIPNKTGDQEISVNWNGDDTHFGFENYTTFTVDKINTNLNVNAPNKVKVGQKTTITGVLRDEFGNLLSNVKIKVIVDGQTFNVTTDDDGMWTLIYTPTRTGPIDVSEEWEGNETHIGSANSTSFIVEKLITNSTVNAPNKVKTNQKTTITGVAKDEFGNPIANTDLNVIVNGKTYTVTTDSEGNWILDYTPTQEGNVDVLVNWEGNDNYFEFTNTTTFNVERIDLNNSEEGNTTEEGNESEDNTNIEEDSNSEEDNSYEENENSVEVYNINNESNVMIDGDSSSAIAVKKTGIPLIAMILMLLSIFVASVYRKQK